MLTVCGDVSASGIIQIEWDGSDNRLVVRLKKRGETERWLKSGVMLILPFLVFFKSANNKNVNHRLLQKRFEGSIPFPIFPPNTQNSEQSCQNPPPHAMDSPSTPSYIISRHWWHLCKQTWPHIINILLQLHWFPVLLQCHLCDSQFVHDLKPSNRKAASLPKPCFHIGLWIEEGQLAVHQFLWKSPWYLISLWNFSPL